MTNTDTIEKKLEKIDVEILEKEKEEDLASLKDLILSKAEILL